MPMTHRASASILIALIACAFIVPPVAAGAQASITIEQVSASSYGTWTLLAADGTSRSSKDKGVDAIGGFSMGITEFGQNTLSVTPPPGMSVKISVYRGGDLVKEVDTPQYSFSLFTNDNYRFVISYALTRVGALGVTSEPSNLRFRMKSSGGRTYSAKTPFTFTNLPAGKYSLYFSATETCLQPAVQTVKVEPEQRNTTKVTLTCNVQEEEMVERIRPTKRSLRDYAEKRETKTRGMRK